MGLPSSPRLTCWSSLFRTGKCVCVCVHIHIYFIYVYIYIYIYVYIHIYVYITYMYISDVNASCHASDFVIPHAHTRTYTHQYINTCMNLYKGMSQTTRHHTNTQRCARTPPTYTCKHRDTHTDRHKNTVRHMHTFILSHFNTHTHTHAHAHMRAPTDTQIHMHSSAHFHTRTDQHRRTHALKKNKQMFSRRVP